MRSRTGLVFASCLMAAALLCAGCGAKKTAQEPPGKSRQATSARKTGPEAKSKAGAEEKKKPAEQAPSGSVLPGVFGSGSLEDFFSGKSTSVPLPGEVKPGSPKSAAGSSAAKPAVTLDPNQRPTPAQLLAAVRTLYASAGTMKIEGTSSGTIKHDGKTVASEDAEKFTVLFKRPNKFVITSPESRISSDGASVYSYATEANRYTKATMADEVLADVVRAKMGVGVMGLLVGVDYGPAITSAKLLKDATVAGRDAYVLTFKLKPGVACPEGMDATQTLWIGKKDLGIYRNELVTVVKPKPPKDYKGPVPKSIRSTLVGTMTSFAPNAKLADSAFVFKPPAGAKPFEQPKQVDLKGKHAPDFSFKWTDGSVKKLSDFRGRYVLLDFWALPFAEEHLPSLQKLHQNRGEGVELIAINLNEKADKVAEFLKEKGFDFPVVYANEEIGRVAGEKYGLMALPTVFIIDEGGVVRAGLAGNPTESDIREKLTSVRGE